MQTGHESFLGAQVFALRRSVQSPDSDLLQALLRTRSVCAWLRSFMSDQSRAARASMASSTSSVTRAGESCVGLGWSRGRGDGEAASSCLPASALKKPNQLGKQGLNVLKKLERRETRKVGQREEKRTREAGTKMQCSTW